MSTTLSWASSGAGTKTGTTNALLLDDIDTLITSKSADATFKWEVAGKSNAGTPRYLLLRRKDASAGRIALIIWDSAPANNNVAILDGAPTNGALQFVWFPAGTGTTLSNLTAASGTICGTDTGVVKCVTPGTVANLYAASLQCFYFDSAEAMVFCFQNPAVVLIYAAGAGDLVVDAADTAYGGSFAATSSAPWNNFGVSSQIPFPWTTSTTAAGLSTGNGTVRTNYGSSNRQYFMAWIPSSSWVGQTPSVTDVLTDSTTNRAWFLAPQLLGQTKGEGPVLKLRQIAFGPGGTVGPLTAYNTTGPVVAARQATIATTGGNGPPWMVNFKV